MGDEKEKPIELLDSVYDMITKKVEKEAAKNFLDKINGGPVVRKHNPTYSCIHSRTVWVSDAEYCLKCEIEGQGKVACDTSRCIHYRPHWESHLKECYTADGYAINECMYVWYKAPSGKYEHVCVHLSSAYCEDDIVMIMLPGKHCYRNYIYVHAHRLYMFEPKEDEEKELSQDMKLSPKKYCRKVLGFTYDEIKHMSVSDLRMHMIKDLLKRQERIKEKEK